MKTTFLYRDYAEANDDISAHFGTEDAAGLQAHFEAHGRAERRGVRLEDYVVIEKVLLSEEGHLCVSGWADRRIANRIPLSLIVGYAQYDFGDLADQLCWYRRSDVAEATGDAERSGGFVYMIRIPDFAPHSDVRVMINEKTLFSETSMKCVSVRGFLREALTTCAPLADLPIGTSLPLAEQMSPAFDEVWQAYLAQQSFTCLYQTGAGREVDRSIVITLYRETTMLLPQLETLAPGLADQPTEVVLVLNEYTGDTKVLVEQLAAFCQIHDVILSVHQCSGNSGFSAGNNYGARQARGEILIFMNPDIFPPEGQEDQAFAFLAGDPGEGLDGALLYYGDGTLMHSGMYTTADLASDARQGVSAPVLRVEHYGKGLTAHVNDSAAALDQTLRDVPEQGLLVTAALWRIRRRVFYEMQELPTDYILAYYEDADFCLKMLEAGRPVRLDRASRWIHMEGVGKKKPAMLRTVMWLNRALYSRRFARSRYLAPAQTDLFQL